MNKYKQFGFSNTKKMLAAALCGGYAVPAYNFSNAETLRAILTACAQTKSPVILQVSPGALNYIGADILIPMVVSYIKKYAKNLRGRVALHLDHGTDFATCKKCIDMGFSSVMIDASKKSFDENIKITRRVTQYAKKFNVSVEGELGQLGIEKDKKQCDESVFTNPNDAKIFVEKTGVDSLAVSIGTSHGVYKLETPNHKLRFDILVELERTLKNFPLVLHGASGVQKNIITKINKFGGKIQGANGMSSANLIRAREMNVCKINIDSDARLAFTMGIRESLARHPDNFDPRVFMTSAIDAMIKLYTDKNIKIMGSANKI
ncbi:MAG: ketose-bisphosphate aldolase [Rickettsiales bacterium]|jgi:fructose-bisphosphate aldolase class II|nr:ketose-bisphosphate aldolase [Rickettsiales bacterium]